MVLPVAETPGEEPDWKVVRAMVDALGGDVHQRPVEWGRLAAQLRRFAEVVGWSVVTLLWMYAPKDEFTRAVMGAESGETHAS